MQGERGVTVKNGWREDIILSVGGNTSSVGMVISHKILQENMG